MSDEFNAPELMGFPKYLQQKGTGWHCQAVPYRARKVLNLFNFECWFQCFQPELLGIYV